VTSKKKIARKRRPSKPHPIHAVRIARRRYIVRDPKLKLHVVLDAIMHAHGTIEMPGSARAGTAVLAADAIAELVGVAEKYLARARVAPKSDAQVANELITVVAKCLREVDNEDEAPAHEQRERVRRRAAAQISAGCMWFLTGAMFSLGWRRPPGTPIQIADRIEGAVRRALLAALEDGRTPSAKSIATVIVATWTGDDAHAKNVMKRAKEIPERTRDTSRIVSPSDRASGSVRPSSAPWMNRPSRSRPS
jgi:hypothetical protein